MRAARLYRAELSPVRDGRALCSRISRSCTTSGAIGDARRAWAPRLDVTPQSLHAAAAAATWRPDDGTHLKAVQVRPLLLTRPVLEAVRAERPGDSRGTWRRGPRPGLSTRRAPRQPRTGGCVAVQCRGLLMSARIRACGIRRVHRDQDALPVRSSALDRAGRSCRSDLQARSC